MAIRPQRDEVGDGYRSGEEKREDRITQAKVSHGRPRVLPVAACNGPQIPVFHASVCHVLRYRRFTGSSPVR